MQDLVGGDNNRTPVVFRTPDNYKNIGDVTTLRGKDLCQKSSISLDNKNAYLCRLTSALKCGLYDVALKTLLASSSFIDCEQSLKDDVVNFVLLAVVCRYRSPIMITTPAPTTFDMVEIHTSVSHDGNDPEG
jgi:hypothetical protein